jgi:hypothetical protein
MSLQKPLCRNSPLLPKQLLHLPRSLVLLHDDETVIIGGSLCAGSSRSTANFHGVPGSVRISGGMAWTAIDVLIGGEEGVIRSSAGVRKAVLRISRSVLLTARQGRVVRDYVRWVGSGCGCKCEWCSNMVFFRHFQGRDECEPLDEIKRHVNRSFKS